MSQSIHIEPSMLTWAIQRAGFGVDDFVEKNPRVERWLTGQKEPTVKQLEDFARKVYLPFGYLFLTEPPEERLPIPFFRSNARLKDAKDISIHVYDTVLLLQQRQDWLREYLQDNGFEPLPFVGKFGTDAEVLDVVADIRSVLGLEENWAAQFKTWEEAQNHLVAQIENAGIITVFNGVVENNSHRKIPVEDCRGFVLVDEYAPFMFVNNSDFKSAQIFTILHELAHVWTGKSAGFDFRDLLPANDPIERLCDKVAAEFLVPQNAFDEAWNTVPGDLKKVAKHFKVSEIVIARRALDLGKWSKTQFLQFYNEYKRRYFLKKESQTSGGDFFATARKRISITFAAHVQQAVRSGQLLYRDAYKLTSLKGDTYDKFFAKQV